MPIILIIHVDLFELLNKQFQKLFINITFSNIFNFKNVNLFFNYYHSLISILDCKDHLYVRLMHQMRFWLHKKSLKKITLLNYLL